MADDAVGDSRAAVLALLQMSGLSPSPGEIDRLVAAYPAVRSMASSLYVVPDVRYEDAAFSFDPRVVAR
jgi:hypothetical protein